MTTYKNYLRNPELKIPASTSFRLNQKNLRPGTFSSDRDLHHQFATPDNDDKEVHFEDALGEDREIWNSDEETVEGDTNTESSRSEDLEDSDTDSNNSFTGEYGDSTYDTDDLKKLFAGSNVTKKECAVLIFSYIIRHSLTGAAVDDLLMLLQTLLPTNSRVPRTKYHLRRAVKCNYELACRNYYCVSCKLEVSGEIMQCSKCLNIFTKKSLMESNGFFLSFDLSTLLQNKLTDVELGKSVTSNLESRSGAYSTALNDISDGSMYKSLNLDRFDLTCSVNIDGVPAFKSSNCSLYPLLISINEASFSLRRRHTIVAGMWFGSGKPNFDLFLKPFIQNAKSLAQQGFKWNFDGSKYFSRVYFPIFIADSVARCCVQGLTQFNGEFGCPWCLTKGSSLPIQNGKYKRIYLPLKKSEILPRSHSSFLEQLEVFSEKLLTERKVTSYFGIKSASILLTLPKFNIVNGFVFDYMHTCLLGVTRSLAELWFDSKNHSCEFYLGRQLKGIDIHFINTFCPSEIPRATRSILHRRFWKSSEWKTWLFVSPSFLNSFLPKCFFDHFNLFSKAMFILCGTDISPEDVDLAEKYIFKFVKKMPKLYSESNCSSNLHLLLHAADCVRNWGPLFCYSAFQFENYNQTILASYNGTRLVAKQVCNRLCEKVAVLKSSDTTNFSTLGLEFYRSQIYNCRIMFNHDKVDSVVLLGTKICYKLSNELLRKMKGYYNLSKDAMSYKKCIVSGVMFDCKEQTKRCNSIVKYNNSVYILRRILTVSCDGTYKCLGVANKIVLGASISQIMHVKSVKDGFEIIELNKLDVVKFFCKKDDNNLITITCLPNYVEME